MKPKSYSFVEGNRSIGVLMYQVPPRGQDVNMLPFPATIYFWCICSFANHITPNSGPCQTLPLSINQPTNLFYTLTCSHISDMGLLIAPFTICAPFPTMTPNSVSSQTLPPILSLASSTVTWHPKFFSWRAAARPDGPAPMTTTFPWN